MIRNFLSKLCSFSSRPGAADPPGPEVCHSPFKNMRFTPSGRVLACCINGEDIMGWWPARSLADIWRGREAGLMRARLAGEEAPPCCRGCRGASRRHGQEDFPGAYLASLPFSPDQPQAMEFSLENTCNLECIMCHGGLSSRIREAREKRAPMSSPYDERFFEELFPWLDRLSEARFAGGEPFLIEAYYRIWARLRERNPDCTVFVQTNGTIFSDRVARVLESGRFGISVSLDSLDEKLFSRIRKNAHLGIVMGNLERFRNYCLERGTYFGLSVCVMPQNWEELPALVRFACQEDIAVSLNLVSEPLWASLRSLDSGSVEGVREALAGADIPAPTKLAANNRKKFEDLVQTLDLWVRQAKSRENAAYSGDMTRDELFCLLKEKVRLHLKEHPGFADVWKGGVRELEESLGRILVLVPQRFSLTSAHEGVLQGFSGGRLLLSMERYSEEVLARRVDLFVKKAII